MITAELDDTIAMRPIKELDHSDDGLNGGDACLAATVFVLWVLLTQRAERRTVDQVRVGGVWFDQRLVTVPGRAARPCYKCRTETEETGCHNESRIVGFELKLQHWSNVSNG